MFLNSYIQTHLDICNISYNSPGNLQNLIPLTRFRHLNYSYYNEINFYEQQNNFYLRRTSSHLNLTLVIKLVVNIKQILENA